MIPCNICSSLSNNYIRVLLLNKYNVQFYKCKECGFIQTEKPYWLREAYDNAITELDIGLISRNLYYSPIVEKIITNFFDPQRQFLDFGGGYGLFVRLMRDRGFDFYRYDTYCDNLFAKHFDIINTPILTKFNLLTAFEVFEHLEDPKKTMEEMLNYSDNILFSTNLQPNLNPNPQNWWYFTPETGQHISLYTKDSLVILGKKFGLNYYGCGNLHLFTKQNIKVENFKSIATGGNIFNRIFNKIIPFKTNVKSLISHDLEKIKTTITR